MVVGEREVAIMMMMLVEEAEVVEEENVDSSGGSTADTPTIRTTSPLHRTVGETTLATLVAHKVVEKAVEVEVDTVVEDMDEAEVVEMEEEEERPMATKGHAGRGRTSKSFSA